MKTPNCQRLLILLILILGASVAGAHPMGNFSINHYTRLEARPGRIEIHYILDLAEIPTVTEKGALDANGDGRITPEEQDRYLHARAAEYGSHLTLTLNGKPQAITLHPERLELLPGAGGLQTLRLTFSAALPAPAGNASFAYQDDNFPERTGWKEIVARGEAGAQLLNADVAAQDLSHELTLYPRDPAIAPPQQLQAHFGVALTAQALGSSPPSPRFRGNVSVFTSASPGIGDRRSRRGANSPQTLADGGVKRGASQNPATPRDAFTQSITAQTLTPGVLLLGLLLAFFFGAGHALSPGHGKAMVAAYLVGARGTTRHALLLGLTVTITHVMGVYLLGLVTLVASQYIVPEHLYTVLSVISGVAVCGVGLSLLISRLRGLSQDHSHHDHDHSHDFDHAHDHDHTHENSRDHDHFHNHDPEHAHPHDHDHVHEYAYAHSHTHAQDHNHSHVHSADTVHDHHHNGSHSHDLAHDHPHDHDHGHSHDHDHGHSHGFGHHHHHHIPEGPITVRSLIALGISGGIVPCPSALVVLLSAIALHRLVYGLMLITAFSAGLAAVLVALGIVVVSAKQWVTRLPASGALLKRLPVASAAVIMLVGAVLIVRALHGMP